MEPTVPLSVTGCSNLPAEKKIRAWLLFPSASSHVGGTISDYEEYFVKELGLKKENVWSVPLAENDDPETLNVNEGEWKDNAYYAEMAEKIIDYNIIYFVGGDQRRYIDVLKRNNIDFPIASCH